MSKATACCCLLALAAAACVPNDGRPRARRDGGVAAALRPSVDRPRLRFDASAQRRADAGSRDAAPAAMATEKVRVPPGPSSAAAGAAFEDDFERRELGLDWRPTSAVWRIDHGRLCGHGARNHPVWLVRPLSRNARVEFDAVSSSVDGDIKAELWGDGRSFATGVSYGNATSYLVIFGGWKNQLHVLARLDEHGRDRAEIRLDASGKALNAQPVEPERSYHFKVERADGITLRWMVDDIEILSFKDPAPLSGPGHEHVAFNDWEVPVCFDNLMITPLAD